MPNFFGTMKHFDLGRHSICASLRAVFIRSTNECPEKRMRFQRFGLELRVKLAADKVWVIRNLYHLNVGPIRCRPRNAQPSRSQRALVFSVEFVAVTMALADFSLSVHPVCQGAGLNL